MSSFGKGMLLGVKQFDNILLPNFLQIYLVVFLSYNMLSFKEKSIYGSIAMILFSLVFSAVPIGYLNILFSQLGSTIEPFFILLICTLLVILIAISKMPLSVNKAEMYYLLFISYIVIKNILANSFDVSSISYLLFFVILYYELKSFFSLINNSAYTVTLLFATTIILFAYLAFALYHCFIEKETLTNLFIPNKSIFSILLASQVAFIIPLWFNYRYRKRRFRLVTWIFFIVIIASLLLLGLTKGRAGWVGLSLAIFYNIYQYLSNPRIKKRILFFLLPFFIMAAPLLFWYKLASSEGMMLIYKISAGMLKDNWLWGIGHGQFKAKYNEYQAAYFSSHSIDSKEAVLADNSIYAFNDFGYVITRLKYKYYWFGDSYLWMANNWMFIK